jgi:hypothetical protein
LNSLDAHQPGSTCRPINATRCVGPTATSTSPDRLTPASTPAPAPPRSPQLTVKHRPSIDISRELSLGICKKTHIELFLLLGKEVPPHDDRPRRQTQIVCSLKLGAAEHHPVQQDLELLECRVTRVARFNTVSRDRREDLSDGLAAIQLPAPRRRTHLGVPETDVVHRLVLALITVSLV